MGTQTVGKTNRENRNQFDVFDRTRGESEAEVLHRLAAQAKARGIKIIQNIVTNAHFATSASRPGTLHKVTLLSCDCLGFVTHGRGTHFAAILEYYCSLPPIEPVAIAPEPDPDGGGGVALPVPSHRPAVEGARPAYSGTRGDGSTYLILHADAVAINGVLHRIGDGLLVTDRRSGWTEARITCIRTGGATGRVWKVDVDGTGYGETTRSLVEVRAIAATGEEVRHAA